MYSLNILRSLKWVLLSSGPSAMLARLLPFVVLQYCFRRAIWVAGIPVVTGIPLRQLDNLISSFVIHEATPGPFLAKVTRLWKFAKISKGDFHNTLLAAHHVYGSIVQIGPNEYSIDDPSAIDQIYRGPGGGFRKADWYSCSTSPLAEAHSLFSVRDRDRHRVIRRQLAPFYRKESVQRYGGLLDPCVQDLKRLLDTAVHFERPVDLASLMNLFAFDTIGRITTSNSFGALRGDEAPVKFIEALRMALKYFATVGDFSEWHPCLFAITQYTPALNGLPLVNHFVESQIQLRLHRTARKAQKADMISDFMPRETIDSDPEKDHNSLRHLCETNILPGADTTATAICAAIFYLSQSPESIEMLRQALKEIGDGSADDTAEKPPNPHPYLQAVVQEAMRLHSPVGLTLPRVVPEGGTSICGHYFAAGSIVGVNPYAIHHNAQVWGADHNEFRPERWLVDDDSKRKLDRAFFAWGAGSRECVGKHIGLLQIYRALEFLVSRYDFDIDEKDMSWANFQFTQFTKLIATIRERTA